MEKEYFECSCCHFDHTFRVVFDPDDKEIWMEIHMSITISWWRRAWKAIKYIFGRDVEFGHYDEIMIKREDLSRLIAMLEKAKID